MGGDESGWAHIGGVVERAGLNLCCASWPIDLGDAALREGPLTNGCDTTQTCDGFECRARREGILWDARCPRRQCECRTW